MADVEEEEVGRGPCNHLMTRRRATSARRAKEQQHCGHQRNLSRLKMQFGGNNFSPWTFFQNRTNTNKQVKHVEAKANAGVAATVCDYGEDVQQLHCRIKEMDTHG